MHLSMLRYATGAVVSVSLVVYTLLLHLATIRHDRSVLISTPSPAQVAAALNTSTIAEPQRAREERSDERPNAVLYVLVRNDELDAWLDTMREFERNFNTRHNYPYLFVNNKPFDKEFKRSVRRQTRARTHFATIAKEHWSIPAWIDQAELDRRMRTSLKRMLYGSMMSYHHMCRFYSGFFFRQPKALQYDYYWRLEPGVRFPCKLKYDPIRYMIDNDKLYGFVMSTPERQDTIPTLLPAVNKWLRHHHHQQGGNVSDNNNDNNNNVTLVGVNTSRNAVQMFAGNEGADMDEDAACVFFNNFEIASFALYRNATYLSFFDFLDKIGGFFYERWGDASVHTFYMTFMLDKRSIHLFEDIAYEHEPYASCAHTKPNKKGHCKCETRARVSTERYMQRVNRCFFRWKQLMAISA